MFCALKKAKAMKALSTMAPRPMIEKGAANEEVMGGGKFGAVKTGVGDPKMGTGGGGGRGFGSLSFLSFFLSFLSFFFFFFFFIGALLEGKLS